MNQALQRALDFLQSLKNYILTGGHLVDQNIANQRAEICIGCHANVPGDIARPKTGGCGSCAKFAEDSVIKATKLFLLQGRSTPNNSKLLSCSICGCDNQLQVWFPTVVLQMNSETINAYPSFCWKKVISL